MVPETVPTDNMAQLGLLSNNNSTLSPHPTTPQSMDPTEQLKRDRSNISTGFTPTGGHRPFSHLPEEPIEQPNFEATEQSERLQERSTLTMATPYAINPSRYKLPYFENWTKAKQWFGKYMGFNTEESQKELEDIIGPLKAIIFLDDAIIDQSETPNQIQNALMGGFDSLFGPDAVSYETPPAYNSPRMNISMASGLMNLCLDTFIAVDNNYKIHLIYNSQIYFTKELTLKLTLHNRLIDNIHGFDLSSLSVDIKFTKQESDICFNIFGLPTFYKGRQFIPEMIEAQIPGLEVCKRSGSIVFNKARYTNLKEGDTVTYVPDHLDDTKLKEASGFQVYTTRESFFKVLDIIYVQKAWNWPPFITFSNNDGSAPYNCSFSFQQLDFYNMPDGRTMNICGACKRPGCHYKNEDCIMRKLKQNKDVAAYNDKKRQRVQKKVNTLEAAKLAKIKYSSGTKNRFAP